jgi:hypothetical protein
VELKAVGSAFTLGIYSLMRGFILIFFSLMQSSEKQFHHNESTGWWALPAFYMLEIVAIVLCVLLLLETPSQTEVKTAFFPQLITNQESSREIATPRAGRGAPASKPPLAGELATTPRRNNTSNTNINSLRLNSDSQRSPRVIDHHAVEVVCSNPISSEDSLPQPSAGRDRISSAGSVDSSQRPKSILKKSSIVGSTPPVSELAITVTPSANRSSDDERERSSCQHEDES